MKVVAFVFLLLSGAVMVALGVASARHGFGSGSQDWLLFAAPLVSALICAAVNLRMITSPVVGSPVRRGLGWGACFGANGFLLLLAVSLATRFQLITADGTAYWGLLTLPSIFAGPPALVIGALLGALVGKLHPQAFHA